MDVAIGIIILVLLGGVGISLCVAMKGATVRRKKLKKWRSGDYGELGEKLTNLEERLRSQDWPGLPFKIGKKNWIINIITAQLAGQTFADLESHHVTGKLKESVSTIWELVEAEMTDRELSSEPGGDYSSVSGSGSGGGEREK